MERKRGVRQREREGDIGTERHNQTDTNRKKAREKKKTVKQTY